MKILSAFFALLLLIGAAHGQGYNSLRMAYTTVGSNAPIPDGFLSRTRAAGYNYILSEYNLWHYYSGAGQWPNGRTDLEDRLQEDFEKVDGYGMRLIPLFQTGSMWSRHWQAVDAGDIDWVPLPAGHKPGIGMPSYAPTQGGNIKPFGTYFQELLQIIENAFNRATLSYSNLEYVHIGHDEAVDYNTRNLLVGRSAMDQQWMLSHPGSDEVDLMIFELEERVADAVAIVPGTRLLIWADMWDPWRNGNPYGTADLANRASNVIRNNVIFMPWQYDAQSNGADYPTVQAYRTFSTNNLQFLFTMAIADNGQNRHMMPRMPQVWEHVNAGGRAEFRNHLLGYCSAHWDGNGWGTEYHPPNKDRAYDLLEFLSHTHYYQIPAVD